MKKEDWINNILESASEIEQAEANPFLFNKITNQLNQPKTILKSNIRHNLGWAVAISIVIAINIFSLVIYKTKIKNQNESASIETLTNELNLNITYNY